MGFKQNLLQRLARLISRYPGPIVLLSVLLAVFAGGLAFLHLKIDTDQDNLISEKLAYHARYKDYLKNFGDNEFVYVVFEVGPDNLAKAKSLSAELADRLSSRPDLFREIHHRIDTSSLEEKGLYLLPQADFDSFTAQLANLRPPLSSWLGTESLDVFLKNVTEALAVPSDELKKNSTSLEALFPLLSSLMEGLADPEKMESWDPKASLKKSQNQQFDSDGFFLSPSGKLLFVTIMPVKNFSTMDVVGPSVAFIREALDEIKKENPDINVGLTGRPVLQADEMNSTGSDSAWASIASVLGVGLLYILYLRNLRKPLLIIVALICAVAWTTGFITLAIGHLNLLTLVFGIILVGIGVDYGMHFLLRYLKERESQASVEVSLVNTYRSAGQSIVTGGIATALAFLTALVTDFLGLKELGIIAGAGVMFCLISQLVTLPALLVLEDKKIKAGSSVAPSFKWFDPLYRKPALVLILVGTTTLCGLPFLKNVRFEDNLLKLQDPNLPSVVFEKKIIDDAGFSTWFAVMTASTKEELEAKRSQALLHPEIGGTESILDVSPLDPGPRQVQITNLKEKIFPQPQKTNKTPHALLQNLHTELTRLQSLAFEGGDFTAVEKMDGLIQSLTKTLQGYESNASKADERFAEASRFFAPKWETLKKDFLKMLSAAPPRQADLPAFLQKRYAGQDGAYVLYVYPKKDIWDPVFMQEFISSLRQIDPLVTGAPISVYESAKRLKNGFLMVGGLTLALVFILLLLDFRNLSDALVAACPLVSGVIWLGLWMAFFDIDLNLGNFFALPILIGLGIDNGVHLVHHYREKRSVTQTVHHVAPAVILSTLTTLIGFGALSFVRHKGLASFGQIMTLGSATCLMASLLVVPCLLLVLEKWKGHVKTIP